MFGFEESYGYLVKLFICGKDAIQALLLLAEVAAYYKKQGKTLYDGLQMISETYGYSTEKTIFVTVSGQEGSVKISALTEKFRKEAPTEFAGTKIIQTEDLKELTRTDREGDVEEFTTPPSDVLKYISEENDWIAIHPSGTESKIKFCVGMEGSSTEGTAEKIASYKAIIKRMTEE